MVELFLGTIGLSGFCGFFELIGNADFCGFCDFCGFVTACLRGIVISFR